LFQVIHPPLLFLAYSQGLESSDNPLVGDSCSYREYYWWHPFQIQVILLHSHILLN
jgi:hypothetical protein